MLQKHQVSSINHRQCLTLLSTDLMLGLFASRSANEGSTNPTKPKNTGHKGKFSAIGGNSAVDGKVGKVYENSSPKLSLSSSKERKKNHFQQKYRAPTGDPYDDDVEMLFSDIESCSPLSYLKRQSSGLDLTGVKYFTFIIILVPSMVAIVIPSGDLEISNQLDLAKVITDAMLIVLACWFIKFALEWPWAWRKQIQDTKFKLLNHINSFAINNKVSMGESTDIKLNQDLFVKRLLMVNNLSNYEVYAFIMCFVGTFTGAGIMLLSRKYISIEDSKRNMVFSNLNVSLFILWGAFRLLLAFSEKMERIVSKEIDGKAFDGLDIDYNLITEYNIHNFLPNESMKTSLSNNCFTFLKNMTHFTFVNLKRRTYKHYDQRLGELEDNVANISESLSKSTFQNNQEVAKIKETLRDISNTIDYLKKEESKEQNKTNVNSIFLRPFPLSLEEGSTANRVLKQEPISLYKQPMHTIVEETQHEEESEDYDDSNDRTENIPCIRGYRMYADDAGAFKNNKAGSLSTNSSSFADSIFEPLSYSTNVLKPKSYLFRSHNESVADYAQEAPTKPADKLYNGYVASESTPPLRNFLSQRPNKCKSMPLGGNMLYVDDPGEYIEKEVDFKSNYEPKYLVSLLKSLLTTYAQPEVIYEALQYFFTQEAYPAVIEFLQEVRNDNSQRLDSMRTKVWQFCNKSGLEAFISLKDSVGSYIKPLRGYLSSLKHFFVLVYVKLPLNVIRAILAVILFAPRICYNIFVVYPLTVFEQRRTSYLSTDLPNMALSENQVEEKEAHLNPHEAAKLGDLGYTLKTRKLLLNRLLKPCENSYNERYTSLRSRTPVQLFDKQ